MRSHQGLKDELEAKNEEMEVDWLRPRPHIAFFLLHWALGLGYQFGVTCCEPFYIQAALKDAVIESEVHEPSLVEPSIPDPHSTILAVLLDDAMCAHDGGCAAGAHEGAGRTAAYGGRGEAGTPDLPVPSPLYTLVQLQS